MNYGSKQIRKKIKSLRSPYEKIGRKAVVLFFKLITVCIVVCFVMLTCVGLGAFTGIIESGAAIAELIAGAILADAQDCVFNVGVAHLRCPPFRFLQSRP